MRATYSLLRHPLLALSVNGEHVWFQCRVRHRDTTECRHQKAIAAVSKRDAREAGVPRVQTYETRQS